MAPTYMRTSERGLCLLIQCPQRIHDLVEFNNSARRTFPQRGRSFNCAGIRCPGGKDCSLLVQ